ncbi:MAG TPA: cation diffusion facilitator family transporter [Thermodesulfobacteriota bacterium]|nr:cation diffusion facilitator family transporter [Thermodesulfobacteriota bacterium]
MSLSSREISKNKKFQTALLSISVSLVLIIIKVIFGFLTNSISILASAADSFLDVMASSVNFYSIRKSEKPADHDHKFGHGKAEGLAGLFQTFIIGSSAVYLIYLSVLRLLDGEHLVSVGWGIAVIALSMVVSFFLTRHIKRVAEETGSLILSADSLHYKFDLYTNGGILAGLLAIKITGLNIIDPVISILIAALIIWSTKDILIEAIDILMDKELPPDTVRKIEDVIMGFNPGVKSYHKLKTRNAGSVKFVEFHVVMDHRLTFVESHEIAEEIVRTIKERIGNSEVTVHVDPDMR